MDNRKLEAFFKIWGLGQREYSMDNYEENEKRFLFFGAGKKGKYWLRIFGDFGMVPEGFIDNNKNLCGNLCEGITIYSPDDLERLCFHHIFITCNKEDEIFRQLLGLGVEKEKIIAYTYNIWNYLLYFSSNNIRSISQLEDRIVGKNILFDLQNGMVLGGVEAWSYELAKGLKEKGYAGLYLTTEASAPWVNDNTYPVYVMKYKDFEGEKDKIEICVKKIIENRPCTIICNFPLYIFWSACLAKRLYPNQIRIIAVQHSDDIIYYKAYSLWKNLIDICMTISSCMEHKLQRMGIESDKLQRLEWNIPCKEKIARTWSKANTCLRIGYAGRITIISKRVDLLVSLAGSLKRKHVDFKIHIAGTGEYSKTLSQRIEEENLQSVIAFVGYIDRKNIPDFWSKQDIMVSCSEREGHSISQSEAMAEGAVPVVTDVSGARDDVTDGYNGYVVEVGDIDALADRIQELYLNRDKLEQMGKRAHSTIYERQKNMDQGIFWDDLIKKVWRE